MNKELRRLIQALEAQGFTVQMTKNGHYMVRNADGRAVATFAGSPSDHRSWKNTISVLKRAGFTQGRK